MPAKCTKKKLGGILPDMLIPAKARYLFSDFLLAGTDSTAVILLRFFP
jgi:hypothetical protein